MRSVKPLLSSVLALTTVVATPLDATVRAPVDDQALAEAAMAFFNGRMIAAGFVSDGPAGVSTLVDDDEAALIDSDCMKATGLDLPDLADPGSLPGQTAFAASDVFLFEPRTTRTQAHADGPTTSPMFELILALAIKVDEAHRADLDSYFEFATSEEGAACREKLEQASLSTTGVEFDIEVVATDLGVGDRSAELELHVSEFDSGTTFVMDAAVYFVVTGRTLVALTRVSSLDGPFLDIDDLAELRRIVDSLSSYS